MKIQTKKLTGLARKRLTPLIWHCEKTQGAIADVARRMEAKTGFKPAWNQVLGWLHPKAEKWQMPSYGNGIVLELIWQEVLQEKVEKSVIQPD